jgi:hypothetical protein
MACPYGAAGEPSPQKARLLDFLTGQEAGTPGRDYELKPRKRHNLTGSA